MQKLKHTALALVPLCAALVACEPTPQEKLEAMNLPFTPEAFVEAAGNGNLGAVDLYLQAGMDAGERIQPDWASPLLMAADQGHNEIVELLLSHGAPADGANVQGNTALMFAADKGHTDVARTLLERGANLNAQNSNGASAIGLAVTKGHREIVQLLLDHKANLELRERVAFMTPAGVAAFKNEAEILKLLLDHGADPRVVDENGHTPLSVAATVGALEAATVLLDHGVGPNEPSKGNVTPLMLAAMKGHEQLVQLLLDRGADPTMKTENDYTAYHAANDEKHYKIAQILRKAEADARIHAATFRFEAPEGWSVRDPFRLTDAYDPRFSAMDEKETSKIPEAERTLLTSPDKAAQIILIRGHSSQWMRFIERSLSAIDKLPMKKSEEGATQTKDGIRVDYMLFQVDGGSENEAVHLFGVAKLGSHLLLIDAGGAANRFDPAQVIGVIESLNNNRKVGAIGEDRGGIASLTHER